MRRIVIFEIQLPCCMLELCLKLPGFAAFAGGVFTRAYPSTFKVLSFFPRSSTDEIPPQGNVIIPLPLQDCGQESPYPNTSIEVLPPNVDSRCVQEAHIVHARRWASLKRLDAQLQSLLSEFEPDDNLFLACIGESVYEHNCYGVSSWDSSLRGAILQRNGRGVSESIVCFDDLRDGAPLPRNYITTCISHTKRMIVHADGL